MKENKGNLLTADHLQRMAKGSSLNRSETLKERNLEHSERRKNTRKNKIWVNTFPSSPMFSKFCLTSKNYNTIEHNSKCIHKQYSGGR